MTLRLLISLFAAALLSGVSVAGCSAGDPCRDYVEAIQACYDAGGIESPSGNDYDTLCAGYNESVDDLYTCYAAAYAGKDCSDSADVTEAADAVSACAGS